jgi:hypothetical protein
VQDLKSLARPWPFHDRKGIEPSPVFWVALKENAFAPVAEVGLWKVAKKSGFFSKPFDLPLVSLLNNFKTLEPVKATRHLFAIGLFAENNLQRTRIRIGR